MARVTAGSTRLAKPWLPVAGNQPRAKANTWISNRPIQNTGTEKPSEGRRDNATFSGCHCR
ncbi:hypothetical protein D3C84_1199410 [compost metagenome]